MELNDAIEQRRSVRVFAEEAVAKEVVDELVHAATLAPSSLNTQPWHFHIAMGPARDRVISVISQTTQYLEEYADVLGPEGTELAARFYADLGGAPVVIGVSTPAYEDAVEQRNAYIAVGASIENLMLAATERHLGACNLTVPKWVESELTEVFEIPGERELVSILIVGIPAEEPEPRGRRADVATFLG
ncbi:MAG: nitroreductase family protein [Coriobacteriia bacterium]